MHKTHMQISNAVCLQERLVTSPNAAYDSKRKIIKDKWGFLRPKKLKLTLNFFGLV